MHKFLKLFVICSLLTSCTNTINDDIMGKVGHYSETVDDDPVTIKKVMEIKEVIYKEGKFNE